MSDFRRLRQCAIAVTVIAVATACAKTSVPTGYVAAGPATSDAVQITIEGGAFTTPSLDVPAGQEVIIQITDRDGKNHDFAVPSLNLNTGTLVPGAVATAKVRLGHEPLVYVCTFHADVVGKLVPST
jgi:heme/copper-type cytochrome/quinol oxidase subunit 2